MKEALKLALEALENVTKDYVEGRQYKHNKAIAAIKEALAQPEQEPVACKHEWFRTGAMEQTEFRCIKCGVWNNTTPLQRTWVGLTEEERLFLHGRDSELDDFISVIEAKLRSKNNAT